MWDSQPGGRRIEAEDQRPVKTNLSTGKNWFSLRHLLLLAMFKSHYGLRLYLLLDNLFDLNLNVSTSIEAPT